MAVYYQYGVLPTWFMCLDKLVRIRPNDPEDALLAEGHGGKGSVMKTEFHYQKRKLTLVVL